MYFSARRVWPLLLVAAVSLLSVRAAETDPEPPAKLTGDLDFSIVESIAIQEGGRKKPLQTVVIEQIEQLVGRGFMGSNPSLTDKITGQKIGAMDMFLSIWMETRDWKTVPAILIAYGPLLDELKFSRSEKYFSMQSLIQSARFKMIVNGAIEKRHNGMEKELTSLEQEAEVVKKRIDMLAEISDSDGTLNIIPHPSETNGTWISLSTMVERLKVEDTKSYYTQEKISPVLIAYNNFREAYRARDPERFRLASLEFRNSLTALSPVYPTDAALGREITYNKTRPFGMAWMFYLCSVIFGLLIFRTKSLPLYVSAFGLFLCGLGFHIYGFVLRCLIAGRPPVSNMYESVVWVGFGAVFFSLIFELIYRKRYFMLCGASAGFFCLVLMDLLPVITGNADVPGFSSGISPLVPVLRNNFWLTVHVLTITLSYAAFMLTWVLGHVTLARHLLQPAAKAEQRELHQFVYRAMQVGVLLLACGTILGGVWAYYSWGRFWGWDPKETWAFIALMCYLFVLHGRFAGWWGNFGLSVGSVVCFQAVAFAWYGVNFILGTGLHSYGFGSGGTSYVVGVMSLDVIFTGLVIARHVSYQRSERAAGSASAAKLPDAQSASAGE